MKNLTSFKNILSFSVLILLVFFSSCKDECAGVNCSNGEVCIDGNCITVGLGNGNQEEQVSGIISSNTTWSANKFYILNGPVVVDNGVTLKIEPGTIIKGAAGLGTSASALIIARGGKLLANGTPSSPIIMTAESDNIEIGQITGTNLTETDNGLWGGLIILGNAPVSDGTGDTQGQIEGIPTSESYGAYGGTDASDNSGILAYVSVRHGGTSIGSDNEINGITLGGVGTGTDIHHVEVVANSDDGIECFGGTVDIEDAIVVYQGDDGIDIDQNYSGTIKNFMVITGDGIGTDEALEIDGPEGSTNTNGLFTLLKGTLINEGSQGSGGDLKSNAQGSIKNCVWQGAWPNGLKIRASFSDTTTCTSQADAWINLTQSSGAILKVQNSKLLSSTLSLADFANGYTVSGGNCYGMAEESTLDAKMAGWNNIITTSADGSGADQTVFAGWSWAANNGKL